MRRTHSSLMRELEVDPKLVADQLGHSLDVHMNVYVESGLDRRKEALRRLEEELVERGREPRSIM
jgi:integrase